MNDHATFLEKLSENFVRYADRIALSDDINYRGYTYADLDRVSGKVYSYLSRKGIGPEDFVMINLPRSAKVFAVCVGVWRAGAAFTICEEGYPKEKVDYIYRDCGCKLRITLDMTEEILAEPYRSGFVKCDEHTAAYAGYTSGTTGNPKGIIHEIGTLTLARKSHSFGGRELFRSDDVIGLTAPLNFAAAVMQMNPVLCAGAELAVVPYAYGKDPVKLRQYFTARSVTVGFLTPSLLRLFAELPESLRMLFLSSEPACDIHYDNIDVYNLYAQTETGCLAAAFKVDRPYPITPVGRSQIAELDLRVLDENNQQCAPGEMGELCFENRFFRGYVNLPEMTERAKRGGVYHTGDIGKYLPDGNIVLLGRNDDMVKINGNRVEPAEVEKALKDVLKVKWAAAKAIKTEKRIFVCAYYTEEPSVDLEEAKRRLAEKLPAYMVPSCYMRIDSIPLNANGKFSRKDLPAPAESRPSQGAAYAAPETEHERLLAEAFGKVLKLERVGIDDDFYELGGDSIMSMEVAVALPRLNLTVSDIFKGRTPRKIAEILSEKNALAYTQEANEAALAKEHLLTPFQRYILDYQLYTINSTMWNLPVFMRTRRNPPTEKVIAAFRAVMNAHPALKTRIRFGAIEEFVQYYDARVPDIEVERVTEAEMIDIREELVRPFRMIESPLFRCRLFKTERNLYLFMDLHHILGDGTSVRVLINDLVKAMQGETLRRDFYYLMLEENERIHTTRRYIEDKEYYQSLYGNVDWTVHPPTDCDDRNNRFGTLASDIPVDEDDYAKLTDRYGISENALFAGIALLSQAQASRSKDVLLTWTFSGRVEANRQNVIGTLLCDLPIGIRLSDEMTVSDFMQEVKKQISGGLAHASYPYSLFVHDKIGQDDPTCFLYQKDIFNLSTLVPNHIEVIELPSRYAAASNLLTVEVVDNGGKKSLSLEYASSRYNEETIQQFRRNFQKIAVRLVQHLDRAGTLVKDIVVNNAQAPRRAENRSDQVTGRGAV